jgi:predicted methyltransferase
MRSLEKLAVSWLCLLSLAAPSLAAKQKTAAAPAQAEVTEEGERLPKEQLLALLTVLGVNPRDRVADIHAGIPDLTAFLTIQVGDKGKLYAVELDSATLRVLKSRPGLPLERMQVVRSLSGSAGLPAGQVDLVVFADTWRLLKKRSKYLERIVPALAPHGHVAVIDFRDGELPVGPPAAKKISAAEVVREFEEAGWRLVTESNLFTYRYCLVFYPPRVEIDRPYLER